MIVRDVLVFWIVDIVYFGSGVVAQCVAREKESVADGDGEGYERGGEGESVVADV